MKRMNVKVVLALSLVLLVATVAFAEKPKPIFTEDAPPPLAFYSQGVKFGNLVFVSGQLPYKFIDDNGTWVLETASLAAATNQVMANVEAILAKAKLTLDDIIMATVYLNNTTPPPNPTEFNQAYAAFFGCTCPADTPYCTEYTCTNPNRRPPARASINAAAIPKGALLEISVIAGK